MPRNVWQWCAFHRKVEEYPPCVPTSMQHRKTTNAQVSESEATAIAVHPDTGEVVYCFGKPTDPMPDAYKAEGFEKKQFHSFSELQRFCRATGQVNDIEGDWHKDDGFFEEDLDRRRRAEKEQVERYMDEREKVRQAHPDLRGIR